MDPELVEQIKAMLGGATSKFNDIAKEIKTDVNEKITGLATRIEVIESSDVSTRLEQIEKQATQIEDEQRESGLDLPGMTEEEVKKFSFFKAFQAIAKDARGLKNAWENAPLEYKIMHEMQDHVKARHQASIDDSGGLFIPAQVVRDFIDILRARLVLEQDLGARVVANLTQDIVPIPKQVGGCQALYIAENGIPTESELSFGTINLSPHRCASFVTLSNRLLDMANADLENMVRMDMAETIARKIEEAALFGTGGIEPRGLINHPDVTVTQLNAGAGRIYTFDDAEVQRLAIEEANVPGEVKFLSRPSVWSLLKRLKVDHYAAQAVNQDYLAGRPPMSDDVLGAMLGSGFAKTTALPTPVKGIANTAHVIAGVWSDFVMGFWQRMRVRVSREAGLGNRSAFLQNETWWVVEILNDVQVRHGASFHVYDDALTTG